MSTHSPQDSVMTHPRPVLILQLRPERDIADSEFDCFLKYGGLQAADTHRLRIEQTGIPAFLNLDDYSAIIVGGSPFDISTPEQGKSPQQKKVEAGFTRLLQQVVERDFPFLGACSGNGLLGNHLGATISQRYGEPVGCVSLTITAAGREDKLLHGLPPRIDALLGHKEACDTTPEGAVLLVTGDVCPVQMFRVKDNIYATQFHPEADADEFVLRINAYKNHGYFDPVEAESLKREVRRSSTPHSREILRRFVAHYCS